MASPPATASPGPSITVSNPSGKNTNCDISADWAGVIISLVNLVFVIAVFKWSVQDRRAQSKREAHIFWIQDIILSPNRQLFTKFFSKWTEALNTINYDQITADNLQEVTQQRKSMFLEFKTDVQSIRSEIIDPLTTLSSEFSELDTLLNELQDLVSMALQKLPHLKLEEENPKTVPPYQEIRKYKCRFLTILWEAQSNATKLTS